MENKPAYHKVGGPCGAKCKENEWMCKDGK